MREEQEAKRYYVSGVVQGVGYRYFARRVAMRLGLAGYVRNLHDGRVEVYAVGFPSQLGAFGAELERGPRGSSVSNVSEEAIAIGPHSTDGFSIEDDI